MKKYSKKNYFRPTDPNFFANEMKPEPQVFFGYETGTTGSAFTSYGRPCLWLNNILRPEMLIIMDNPWRTIAFVQKSHCFEWKT
jgi:hypothetical protein